MLLLKVSLILYCHLWKLNYLSARIQDCYINANIFYVATKQFVGVNA